MRTAVITIVAGRHDHLLRQRAALDPNVHHVVVAMGEHCEVPGADVIRVADTPQGLPLAQARNAGARRALDAGAELLVFLDVDCIPGPRLLERYRAVGDEPALLCGPVAYLPPASDRPEQGRPHPARPVPPEDGVLRDGDHHLFWTLSFAINHDTWRRVGEFCEDYVGYGGEDTDYGQQARRAGVDLLWVGGAWAYHQHHPTQSPPVQHRDDILRNAAIFHRRWGWWPMEGWLTAFAERGLARYDEGAGRWLTS